MKLWQGRFEEESDPVFEKMNRSLGIDAVLLEVDIRASRAHARSLLGCGVLTQQEWTAIDQGLEQILSEYSPEQVKASPYEDIHTFVEATLASKIGPVAGKLHTGRSRNDQVATDFRLFVRKAIGLVLADLEALQLALVESGARYSDVIIPAYTHLRRAQPIRWSHYCFAYVEMFRRDGERFELIRAKAAMTTGLLTGFLGVMKGLPTGYNKDLQEDKEALLKAFENVRLSLSVLRLSVRTVTIRTDRAEKAASDSFMGATDLADFLVMKGVPFRSAHEIVAHAVREALQQRKQLDEIDLTTFSPLFSELPADYLAPENIVNRKSQSPALR